MDTHPLAMALEIKECRRKIDGYVLAAKELLVQAEEQKKKLADLEDVWTAMHEAEREFDRPRRR